MRNEPSVLTLADRTPGLLLRLRACANRRATFRTWHLSEGLNSLLTTAWHIRYSPIGAASKLLICTTKMNQALGEHKDFFIFGSEDFPILHVL
jgi:hypothetical protein